MWTLERYASQQRLVSAREAQRLAFDAVASLLTSRLRAVQLEEGHTSSADDSKAWIDRALSPGWTSRHRDIIAQSDRSDATSARSPHFQMPTPPPEPISATPVSPNRWRRASGRAQFESPELEERTTEAEVSSSPLDGRVNWPVHQALSEAAGEEVMPEERGLVASQRACAAAQIELDSAVPGSASAFEMQRLIQRAVRAEHRAEAFLVERVEAERCIIALEAELARHTTVSPPFQRPPGAPWQTEEAAIAKTPATRPLPINDTAIATIDVPAAIAAAAPAAPVAAAAAAAPAAQDMVTMAHAQLLGDLRSAFVLIDLDGSGTLTRGEVMRACREKEKVRSLLGLPRLLHGDVIAQRRFEKIFARLDHDGSGSVDESEFVDYFSSEEVRKRTAALCAAPSWIAVAQTLELDPYGPPETRSRAGFELWESESRFEMDGADEWMDERSRSRRTLEAKLEQWPALLSGGHIIEAELEQLNTSRKAELEATTAFPVHQVHMERERIQALLEERMARLYRSP